MDKSKFVLLSSISKKNILTGITQLFSILVISQIIVFFLNNIYNMQWVSITMNFVIIATITLTYYKYTNIKKEIQALSRANTELKDLHKKEVLKNQELENQQIDISNQFDNNSKMLSVISHDVKAPLLSVKNIFELTKNDTTNTQIIEFLPDIRKTVANTIQLLENLLEWSRNKKAGFQKKMEIVHLNTFVIKVVDLYTVTIKSKNLVVEVDMDKNLFTYFDKEMLQTVLRNLICNAVKYTEENGSIIIRANRKNDDIHFEIANTAYCVNDEQIAYLNCKKDEAAKSLQKEVGSGFGLMLVKDFIESNNAKISYSNNANKYIQCNITLQQYTNNVLTAISMNGIKDYLKAVR